LHGLLGREIEIVSKRKKAAGRRRSGVAPFPFVSLRGKSKDGTPVKGVGLDPAAGDPGRALYRYLKRNDLL
jgi:hypothetical protein